MGCLTSEYSPNPRSVQVLQEFYLQATRPTGSGQVEPQADAA
jgi:hypothetical protein